MRIIVDRTGFPLIETVELGAIGIWPITKYQYESYISATNSVGDNCYDKVLKLNPRIAVHNMNNSNYERIFITGITPLEATNYANWMGPGFDILTLSEWRIYYQACRDWDIPVDAPKEISTRAKEIWDCLRKYKKTEVDPITWTG